MIFYFNRLFILPLKLHVPMKEDLELNGMLKLCRHRSNVRTMLVLKIISKRNRIISNISVLEKLTFFMSNLIFACLHNGIVSLKGNEH